MGVVAPNTLQGTLMVQGFSKLLQEKALTEDVLMALSGAFSANRQKVPESIYLNVTDVQSSEHTHQLGMLMPLSGAPTYGNTQNQVGREENQVTKSVTIYKNDYSHAVTNQLFGIDSQDKKFYQLLQKETDQLGYYFKELKGLHSREALLERYSENLFLASPTSAVIAREWSPNWYIKNLFDTQQPVFDQSNAIFTTNVVTSLIAAGTGAAAVIDFQYLSALVHQATVVRKIKTIDIDGKPSYIVLIPSRQAFFLKNPFVTGSFGAAWTAYNRMTDKEMNWPNVLGRFGPLVLVEDQRSPTVLPGGSGVPYTMTAGYMYPGDNDQRSASVLARDIGFLLGKAALIEWESEKLHFEIEQALTYNKRRGHGAFGTYGVQQVQYDVDAAVLGNTREQFSSIVLAFAREPIQN